MPIVGFNIKSISTERENVPKGRIDINSMPKIISVEKGKIGLTKKEPSLNIDFEFSIKYKPEIGEINLLGTLVYLGDDIDKTIKVWDKKEALPKKVEIEVKNFLFRKCLTIGINLSEHMNLPPPIFFPRIISKNKIESEKLKYIG